MIRCPVLANAVCQEISGIDLQPRHGRGDCHLNVRLFGIQLRRIPAVQAEIMINTTAVFQLDIVLLNIAPDFFFRPEIKRRICN